MNVISQLREHFVEITRLKYIKALLDWDQQVCMPNGSVKGRSEQMALIEGIIHEKIVSKKTGDLVKNAEKISDLNFIDSAMLREAKREYEKEVKLPNELVVDIAKTASLGHQAWEKAREKSDFLIFQPFLDKMIKLQKRKAENLNIYPSRYSTLIDQYEPGATHEWISKIFKVLKVKLINIIDKINSSENEPDQSILIKNYDKEKQWAFSLEVLRKMNFDFNTGRQDKSAHPFSTSVSSMDTRITTRVFENYLPTCLFGTIHECGHALYEMGFMDEIRDTILADGSSFGIHESQSRLWENIVGRSREFWTYWYPVLQKYFPENLNEYPEEEFYRSINCVQPSLIRVEADEVTYGLHIILRFELEKEIIENDLDTSELPSIWNHKMETLLGIAPPDDASGVLQDIHWSSGDFGYFPTYTLGNLYASQIYASALKKLPFLSEDFEKGDFSNLLAFLRKNLHQYGKIYRPLDLLKKITGEELNPDYFVNYLEKKFYLVYGI